MLGSTVKIHESGPVPRTLRKAHTRASKHAWRAVGRQFHQDLRPKRFTPEHAQRAGFTRRKGQVLPRGSKAFRNSYYGRKFLSKDHGGGPNQADPLVYSGDSRDAMRTATVTVTSKGARVRYPRTNLNWRPPKSQVNMNHEFSFVTPDEADDLGLTYDLEYSQELNSPG
ncbi:MAG: hypothetical protein AAGA03_14615 [Planctomycetota bacterium]